MLNLRYHVASLAAVFVALAVGIVIGVAIASGGGVEKATLDARNAEIQDLEADLEAAQEEIENVRERTRAIADLMADAYPALMHDRLAGKNIALLCMGSIDDEQCHRDDIERTLTDAGAALPVRVAALVLPVDVESLTSALESNPELVSLGPDGGLEQVGRELGREFAAGEETPVWDAVKGVIAEQVFGASTPADGVVVVRGWQGAGRGATPEEQEADAATEQLLAGILEGLVETGVPVVGAEALRTNPSTIPFFAEHGLSTVNDVEAEAGRLALALLLAGGEPGQYGIGDDVDGVTPPIEPLPAATVEG